LIDRRGSGLIRRSEVPLSLPVEFTLEALEDIEDIVGVARRLSREADRGRIACGQSDPATRTLVIDHTRLLYRLEPTQILVLSADPRKSDLH
jgi:hypothetical protein